MLALFGKYLKGFAPYIVLIVVFTTIQVFCDLRLPDLMSSIIDTGVIGGNTGYIFSVGAMMLVWTVISMCAVVVARLFASRTAMGFGRDVRGAIYRRVCSFGLQELDTFGTSSLITRTTNDVQQLERFLQLGLSIALMSPIMFIGAAIMALLKSPTLSVIIFVAIPIGAVVIGGVLKFATPLLRSLQKRIDNLNRITREGLTGVRVIRAYRREAHEEERFATANRDLADTNVAVARRVSALMPLSMLILNIASILIVWFGAQLIDVGAFQVGNLMAVIQYAMQVLSSILMLSMMFMIWPRAMAAGERIDEVLKMEPFIVDVPDAASHVLSRPASAPQSLRFEGVTFRFTGAEEPSLSDIDLSIDAGKTYAVIGSTGSGKSTLINLIERFHDPSSGRILLDGVDISTIPQTELRKRIAYVPQKTTLFTGTIADNIRYGMLDASDKDVIEAAKAAQAYDFIMAKEDGFDTQITQSGGGLSGGQKQRIAIARALAQSSGLFLFDDSFSALDFKTDALVRAALAEKTVGATVIIVTQRIAAAMDADEVIVLDEGHIAGMGTHKELLESCEVYREIALSQLEVEEV